MEIIDTLGFLLGTWTLERSIVDYRSGILGMFEGTVAIVEVADGRTGNLGRRARYDETGELRFGTHAGPASRSLQYAQPDGTIVLLYFADGRPFTDLDLRGGTWRSIHHCDQDRYELTTLVRSHSEVQEHWRVQGPVKDYEATAALRRVD